MADKPEQKQKTIGVASTLSSAVELQLCGKPIDSEMGAMRKVGDPVTIAGTATPGAKIVGGCAITEGVDAAFFAAWCEQNEGSALLGAIRRQE